ncbi:MAG: hypothetical protein Fur0035_11410 [Anaerolineales bacterium]
MRKILILLLLALAFWCGQALAKLAAPNDAWRAADLRAIDPAADNLLALLIHRQAARCEIRLDLLDLPEPPSYRLEIRLNERVYRFSADSPAPPRTRLSADSALDTLTLSLPDCPPQAQFRANLNGETLTASADGPAPAAPLPVHFIFYNTFQPAATPAQTLRHWDAAHSGPRGERHGLKNLLDAAETNHIPLTLLDLKSPFALPALDALGALNQIRRMESTGLLELPAVKYSPADDDSLALSRFAARAFGLSDQQNYFLADSPPPIFAPQPELTRAGFPPESRHLLYESLISRQPLNLGGDFQKSTWGTGEYAAPALAWLAARPYFSAQTGGLPLPQTAENLPAPAPDEALLTELAQRAPLTDSRLTAAYAEPEIWTKLAAWRKNPQAGLSCAGDRCWLTSPRFFAALDLRGGKVTHFFDGQNQWLAPTGQFFLGISDASRWDFSKGAGADPGQIGGSFADGDDPFRRYRAEKIGAASLSLRSGSRQKVFSLTEDGLTVTFNTAGETLAALAVNPAERFSPGWAGRYRLEKAPGRLGFGLENGPMAWIQAAPESLRAVESFLEALPLLASPEDPNAEMPPGAFLPFPLTVVRLNVTPGEAILISENP